jgi:hypothetical protein
MKTNKTLLLRTCLGMAVAALFLISYSCSPEGNSSEFGDETELNAVDAKGKKARPIKAKLSNFADPNEQAPLICDPQEFLFPLTRNILSGQMSHLGNIQPGVSDEVTGSILSGSFGVPQSCQINLDTFRELITIYQVTYVAANGDKIVTEEYVSIFFPNDTESGDIDYSTGTFTNTLDSNGNPIPIQVVDGDGRFDEASGELFFMNATFGPEGSSWELVGEITY